MAVDLPGHGQSSNASNPSKTHSIPGYAAIIVKMAKKLELEKSVVVGWSLGGNIAIETIPHFPQAKGYMIYSTPPLGFPPDLNSYFFSPTMGARTHARLNRADNSVFS